MDLNQFVKNSFVFETAYLPFKREYEDLDTTQKCVTHFILVFKYEKFVLQKIPLHWLQTAVKMMLWNSWLRYPSSFTIGLEKYWVKCVYAHVRLHKHH